MIILDATTKKIEIILAGAITTSQLPVVASYVDFTVTSYIPGESDTASNSTTAVTIVAAPSAGSQRHVKLITVQNADTASATVTIRFNNNATTRIMCKVVLAVGDILVYTDGEGFRVIDSSGNIKQGGVGTSTHNLLSATHTDSVAASATAGDLIVGNATPAWARLALGSANYVLKVVAGAIAWAQVAFSEITGTISDAQHGARTLANAHTHADLSTVTADQHHNQAHVLNAGDHTVSGLTTGNVLKATAAATFGFGTTTQANTHDSPDTDTGASSLHHTIGAGTNQAAAGDHTHSLKYSLSGYLGAGFSASATKYANPAGSGELGTETFARVVIPMAATVKNLYFRTTTTQSGTGSLVFTVLKNAVATAITVTVAASEAAGLKSDVANSVSFAAGDEISYQFVNNASATSATVRGISIEVDPT